MKKTVGKFMFSLGLVGCALTSIIAHVSIVDALGPPSLSTLTYATSTGSIIDTAKMVKELGEAETAQLLAQAGLKPIIPLEVYEKLDPQYQAVYTPSERRSLAYESGIAEAYGRGVEALFKPVTGYLQKRGLLGYLGWGSFYWSLLALTIFSVLSGLGWSLAKDRGCFRRGLRS